MSGGEQDLADVGAGLELAMSIAGPGQGKSPVHHRLDVAGLDQRPYVLMDCSHDGGLLGNGSCSERRRDDRGAFAQQCVDIELAH